MHASGSAARQSAVVLAGSVTLAACGFLFQMLAAHRLGVVSYGALYALLSLVAVAGIPSAIVAPVLARRAAELRALERNDELAALVATTRHWAILAAGAYVAIALAVAVPLAHVLRVPMWTIPIAGAVAGIGLANGALRSLAQGVRLFGAYALSLSFEGVAKLVAFVALALFGLGLVGALGGFAAGTICGLAVVAVALKRSYAASTCTLREDWRHLSVSAAGAASLTLAMATMGSADVMLVKRFFDENAAGLYACAVLAGKSWLYLTTFISIVLLPHATHRHAAGERTHGVLWTALGAFVVVAALGAAGERLFGALFLRVLAGPAFAGALPLLFPYALAMTALGLSCALATYGIATHRVAFASPLAAGTILTLVAIAVFHPTLLAVARTMAIGNTLTCAGVACSLAAAPLQRSWRVFLAAAGRPASRT